MQLSDLHTNIKTNTNHSLQLLYLRYAILWVTWYVHVVSALKGRDSAMELGVQFINVLLGGALQRCASLLESHLIALSKPCRPDRFAVGEAWPACAHSLWRPQ